MTFPGLKISKRHGLCVAALMAATLCSAQSKFPLRPGEWTATVPNPMNPNAASMSMLFCMNDETWQKALKHNAACSLQDFNITAGGGTYSMSCGGDAFQMKGTFKMVFDGMTHMTSSGTMDMTMGGNTQHINATTDFKWKGPTCDPAKDINLRDHNDLQR